MRRRILAKKFFDRPALAVARDLLGTFLVRRSGRRKIAAMITEVEAYDGPNDKASHAHRGKTKRNEIMFGEAGKWYVYFTYGMHWMLNVVTGPKNYPAAILIRGGIVRLPDGTEKLLNGPGRLTKFLKIGGELNGRQANRKTGLWIEGRGAGVPPPRIKRGKRVGVDYAGAWAKKPYNFKIDSAA